MARCRVILLRIVNSIANIISVVGATEPHTAVRKSACSSTQQFKPMGTPFNFFPLRLLTTPVNYTASLQRDALYSVAEILHSRSTTTNDDVLCEAAAVTTATGKCATNPEQDHTMNHNTNSA